MALGPIVQDGLLAALWSAQGIYAGGVPGATAPVGTPVKFNGHDFLRFDKSRFVEYWGGADDAELMQHSLRDAPFDSELRNKCEAER